MNKLIITIAYPSDRVKHNWMNSGNADCMVWSEWDAVQESLYNVRNKDFQAPHETRMQCVGRVMSGGVLFEHYAIMTDPDFGKDQMLEFTAEWKDLDTTQPFGEWFDCYMLEHMAMSILPLSPQEILDRLITIFGETVLEVDDDEITQ